MTNIEKLLALRNKLVARRRTIVEFSQTTPGEQLSGDTFAKIQSAIDAVDRAVADEKAGDVVRTIAPSPRP